MGRFTAANDMGTSRATVDYVWRIASRFLMPNAFSDNSQWKTRS
jgi:hypothetical protein